MNVEIYKKIEIDFSDKSKPVNVNRTTFKNSSTTRDEDDEYEEDDEDDENADGDEDDDEGEENEGDDENDRNEGDV